MIPSANSESRCSEPPENRLRKPRTLLPVKLSSIESSVSTSIPGAGMKAPSRYSASIPSVKKIFRRISGTANAFAIVCSMGYSDPEAALKRWYVG
jgi:hypothetical protein